MRSVHRCVYKNGMLDAVTALSVNEKKRRENPRHHYTVKFRSVHKTPSEIIRIDAAKFLPDDVHGERKPKDCGLIHWIRAVPEPDRGRPRAHVKFGSGMLKLGVVTVRDRRWLIDRLTTDHYVRHEAKVQWNKQSRAFYLIVAIRRQRPPDPDPEHHRKRVVAMDPGVRRFQTYYDPANGETGTILSAYHSPLSDGNVDVNTSGSDKTTEVSVGDEIHRRCQRIDALVSKVNRSARWKPAAVKQRPSGRKARLWKRRADCGEMPHADYERWMRRRTHQARRQTRRQLGRERARLHEFKRNMHYDAINFLWDHWDVVIVSTASMGEMCRVERRPFNSATARKALSWCHYRFRERLHSSAFIRPGKSVIETDEAYTTQTCGLCGHLNKNVGASKVFRCADPSCGVSIDRDVNGARNIALTVLTTLNRA
jgi:transposase